MAMMMRAKVIPLAQTSECLKFQILSSRRDEFSTRSLSLLFKRRQRCIYKRLPLKTKREEKRMREKESFLSSVFLCVVCLYYCAKRGIMSFCASSCVSSLVYVFLRTRRLKKKSKKLAGEKSITFLISNNAHSNSLSTARWI